MSEIKRATLISFGADKGEDKKQKSVAKTVRLTFTLPESNESTCPVYNYKEELAVAKKKEKKEKPVNNGRIPNGLVPFDEEDDDDVRRIAQQMEAKYGCSAPAKKKRGKDDYADIGMGYDESDPFIDNTDGYDEMIPPHVTTLHGGFYINCGSLEYRIDESASSEEESSSEEEELAKSEKPSRKRVLSDSEGDTETERDKEKVPAEKKQRLSNGLPVVKKKKLLSAENIRQLKKGGSSDEARKKSAVKEGSKDSDSSSPESTMPADKIDNGKEKENKKPVVHTIDGVTKSSDNNNVSENGTKDCVSDSANKDVSDITISPADSKIAAPSSDGETSQDDAQENNRDNQLQEQKMEIVQLPENLPEEISGLITKLKETAAKNDEGKVFTSAVNKLLLSLERKSRCLGKHSKNRIYQHLGPFLKCRKESLLRRAKNLMIQDDMMKLKNLVTELKTQVDMIMPSLLENYEKESLQRKSSREGLEVEDNKQVRMPKRRFSWTEEIKKLFKDLVTTRRRLFTLEGKNKEDLETHMNLYLKTDMQPLWPEGWMSMTALTKMYNNVNEKKSQTSPNKDPIAQKPPAQPMSKNNNVKPIAVQQQNIKENPVQKTAKESVKEVSLTKNIKEIQSAKEASLAKGVKEMQKLATNSMLSIIPVTPRAPTPQESPKPVMNDLTINILENDNTSASRNSLPIEIGKNSGISISPTTSVKTSEESTVIRSMPDTIITPTSEAKQSKFSYTQADSWSIKPMNQNIKPPTDHKIENIIKSAKPENLAKPKVDSPSPENLSKPKTSESKQPENLCKSKNEVKVENSPKSEQKRRDSDDVIILDESDGDMKPPPAAEKKNHVNVIDLTSHPELKRKPGPKSKTKYYDASMIKPVKSAMALESTKVKHSHSAENLSQESMLTEAEHYYNLKKQRSEHKEQRSSTSSSSGLPKPNDGDDIQKVMEDLKVLQKMSVPARSSSHSSDSSSVTSSPVSVISYNKNYTKSSSTSSLPQPSQPVKIEPKPEYTLGYQDVFQRQFLNELKNSQMASVNNAAYSKGFNSGHSSSSVSHPEKFFMNANNNYAQQNSSKYKTNYATQQPANHKQKPQK